MENLSAINAAIAAFERGETRAQASIPKSSIRRGKKGVSENCVGPEKCRKVLCNHEGWRMEVVEETIPELDEKHRRVLDLVKMKCEKDGYKVSTAYATKHLIASDFKLLHAVANIKADIDRREAAFRATGRVCYESYEEAMSSNMKLVDRPKSYSQAIPPNRTRDEAIAYLEEDDGYIKDFMERREKSVYGRACKHTYTNEGDRKRAYGLYEQEGQLRDGRAVFYKERIAEGVLGVEFDELMREYDMSAALSIRNAFEVAVEARKAGDDGGQGSSNYIPSLQPVVEDYEEGEEERGNQYEQSGSQVGDVSDEDDDGNPQWQMKNSTAMAMSFVDRELAEAKKMFPAAFTTERVQQFPVLEKMKDRTLQAMKSKFKEDFDNSATKSVLELFLAELMDKNAQHRETLGDLLATYNTNHKNHQVPKSLCQKILTAGRENADEVPMSKKSRGKKQAVELEVEEEADLDVLRAFAYDMTSDPKGQKLLSPAIKVALAEEAKQYELRHTYNTLLEQKARSSDMVQTEEHKSRKISKSKKISDNLFKQMSRLNIEKEFEKEKISAALIKAEEERRAEKDKEDAANKAIQHAVDLMAITHEQRLNKIMEELAFRDSITDALLTEEHFHSLGQPTGRRPRVDDPYPRAGGSHAPSSQPPAHDPGRDVRQLQNNRVEGGDYNRFGPKEDYEESLRDFPRSRYRIDPVTIRELFRDGIIEDDLGSMTSDAVTYESSDINANPSPEFFESDEPSLADYLPDTYGEEVREVHEVLIHLHEDLCGGHSDIHFKPKRYDLEHVADMCDKLIMDGYAREMMRVCGGSASMAVTFIERANREFDHYFRSIGKQDIKDTSYILEGFQFIEAFWAARKAMDADTFMETAEAKVARIAAEEAAQAKKAKKLAKKEKKAKKAKK